MQQCAFRPYRGGGGALAIRRPTKQRKNGKMTDYKGNWIDPHVVEREAARLRAEVIAAWGAMLRRRIAEMFGSHPAGSGAVRATAA